MKKFNTLSDAGSVKLGNESFKVLVPNGYGDCETEINILEQDDKIPESAKFFTTFSGKNINIYAYDCAGANGSEVIATISGRYGVYYLDGVVFLEKWDDKEI